MNVKHLAASGLLALIATTGHAQDAGEGSDSDIALAAESVVTIEVRKDTSPPLVDGLGDDVSEATRDRVREIDRVLEDADIPRNATGSGLIVSKHGWIVTAAHLVEHAERITVQVTGNRRQRARVIGVNDVTDVALLKINSDDLPAMNLVNGICPSLAQTVYAIGAPFGFGGSVTSGIISAVDRKVDGRRGVLLLQTDAAVNPGNSGGALVDGNGQLLGMVSQVYTGSAGYAGISFAIPVSALRRSVLNILQQAKLKANWTGITITGRRGRYPVNVAACVEEAPISALAVTGVRDFSGMMWLDITDGDVVSAINGIPVSTADEWDWLTNAVPPGGQADVEWMRNGFTSSGSVNRREDPE